MQIIYLLLCLVGFGWASQEEWQQFKMHHKKCYKTLREEHGRHSIFVDNLRKIKEHNEKFKNGLVTFDKGVNQFADWSSEEFVAYMSLNGWFSPRQGKSRNPIYASKNVSIPNEIDWRLSGAVTPVKDQGSCGSCWSFSATGSLEGQNQIRSGKLLSLSEQNLVDCSASYGNDGCGGGLIDSAFQYVLDNGINSESDYPYEATDDRCRFLSDRVVLRISSFMDIQQDNESSLLDAVATIGPISVAIDASVELQFYNSGIFIDDTCSKDALNHGVLVVGYGSAPQTQTETEIGAAHDYWIIKNSWGLNWGESGYIKMKRGINLCGIAAKASFPCL